MRRPAACGQSRASGGVCEEIHSESVVPYSSLDAPSRRWGFFTSMSLRPACRVAGLLLLAILAGCAPRIAAPPSQPPDSAIRLRPPSGLQCLETLAERGALFEIVAERVAANGCQLTNGVSLTRSSVSLDKPATLSCPLAVALSDFETLVVQPAAQKHFKRKLVRVTHFGAYDCRNIRGTRRLSEHARGLALDIGGFELEGNIRISVKEHWRNAGPRSRFLEEVARGACSIFSVVLTPRSDSEHHDHFHLDIGPRPHCGA